MIFEVYRGPVSNTVRIKPSKRRSNYSSTRINKLYRNPKTKEIVYYPELYERIITAIKEASEKYHLNHANIVSCCKGNRKTTGKKKWSYIND